jgi:hypothetical protein
MVVYQCEVTECKTTFAVDLETAASVDIIRQFEEMGELEVKVDAKSTE